MSAGFDPYYKWLGIPPKDQPPHHYRLLGLEAFESDVEVIDAAANRLMAYLQGLSAGEQVEHSEKLLGEIAAVRLCLLDSGRKLAYDMKLRQQLEEPAPAHDPPPLPKRAKALPRAVPMGEAVPVAAAPASPTPVAAKSVSPSAGVAVAVAAPQMQFGAGAGGQMHNAATQRVARSRRQGSPSLLLAGAGFVVLVLAGLGLFLIKGNQDPVDVNQVATNPTKSAPSPAAPAGRGAQTTSVDETVRRQTPEPLAGTSFPTTETNDAPASTPSLPGLAPSAEDLLQRSRQSLREGNITEMIETLEQLSRMPDLPPGIGELVDDTLAQARTAALTNEEAVQLLVNLPEAEWQLAQQDMAAAFPGEGFTFQPIADQFRATLTRALPEAITRRAAAKSIPPTGGIFPDAPPAAAPEPLPVIEDPTGFLQEKGLRLVDGLWTLPGESGIQLPNSKLLKELPDLVKQFDLGAKARVTELAKLEDLREKAKKATGDSADHQKIRDQRAAQELVFADLQNRLRAVMQKLVDTRNQLVIASVVARRSIDDALNAYQDLADDRQVQGALAQLPEGERRLGPSDQLIALKQSLDETDPVVLVNSMPALQVEASIVLSLIVDDRMPLTFFLRDGFSHPFLNAGDARRAGIEPPEDGEKVELTGPGIPPGRKVLGRLATVSSLRLGSHVAKDVQVLVLPSNIKDIPNSLPMDIFKPARAEYSLSGMTFTLIDGLNVAPPANN